MSDFGINLTNSTPSVNGSSEIGSSSKTTKLKEGLFKNDGVSETGDDVSFDGTNIKPPFGNGKFDNSDYSQDIDERPWQTVDINLLSDLSLLDNEELFPKEKLMAMATQYSLGNQELTPEIKQYLEKKLGITINEPPSEETSFSSVDSSFLTPNVIKTLSNAQLSTLIEAHTNGTQKLTDAQLQYIEARNIDNTEGTDTQVEETDEFTQGDALITYEAFDPTQITLEEFIEKYNIFEVLQEIAKQFLEGEQPLSTEIKEYIEKQLGQILDETYTPQEKTIETNDEYSIDNETTSSDTQTQQLDNVLPDIVSQGNNPFTAESFSLSKDEIRTISSDTLINIQQTALEEYIELYDQNPDLIQFADEHTETQFMQLYNDYKEQYRKESEDLPEEVKNKLEANAGGAGTT